MSPGNANSSSGPKITKTKAVLKTQTDSESTTEGGGGSLKINCPTAPIMAGGAVVLLGALFPEVLGVVAAAVLIFWGYKKTTDSPKTVNNPFAPPPLPPKPRETNYEEAVRRKINEINKTGTELRAEGKKLRAQRTEIERKLQENCNAIEANDESLEFFEGLLGADDQEIKQLADSGNYPQVKELVEKTDEEIIAEKEKALSEAAKQRKIAKEKADEKRAKEAMDFLKARGLKVEIPEEKRPEKSKEEEVGAHRVALEKAGYKVEKVIEKSPIDRQLEVLLKQNADLARKIEAQNAAMMKQSAENKAQIEKLAKQLEAKGSQAPAAAPQEVGLPAAFFAPPQISQAGRSQPLRPALPLSAVRGSATIEEVVDEEEDSDDDEDTIVRAVLLEPPSSQNTTRHRTPAGRKNPLLG